MIKVVNIFTLANAGRDMTNTGRDVVSCDTLNMVIYMKATLTIKSGMGR